MEGHWSALSLEQAVEVSMGVLPREVESLDEIRSPADRARFPTPTAGDSKSAANLTAGRSNPDSQHHSGVTLTDFVRLWPTPRARDGKGPGYEDDLPSTVQRWPTPTKSDGEGGPGNSGRQGGENLRTAVGGQLNPTWVEWLMGFPLGWTVCAAWETRSSRRSRSGSGRASSTTNETEGDRDAA
jgi:hypothetical protein